MQRVLVIETDNDIRTLLLLVLQRRYMVCGAPDGVRGMQLIQEFRPDLIVMELELPLLSGWSIIRQIKSSYSQRSVPTIATTTYGHPSYRLRAYLAGFDEVLIKPFDLYHFLDSVHILLCRPSKAIGLESGVVPC